MRCSSIFMLTLCVDVSLLHTPTPLLIYLCSLFLWLTPSSISAPFALALRAARRAANARAYPALLVSSAAYACFLLYVMASFYPTYLSPISSLSTSLSLYSPLFRLYYLSSFSYLCLAFLLPGSMHLTSPLYLSFMPPSRVSRLYLPHCALLPSLPYHT